MAERWVSVGKKYCEICKCWFADNRASIEFHERGERHRNALAQKLRDVGKTRELKQHAEITLQGQLAAMQAGAFLSMKKHGDQHGDDEASSSVTGVQGSKYFDPRGMGHDVSAMAAEMARLADQRKNGQYRRPDGPSGPVPVKIDKEALAKAQNAQIREGQRRARKQARLEQEKEKKRKIEEAAKEPLRETREWVQAQNEEGQTYYFHMLSGATSWEEPAEFFTPVEYEIYLATLDAEKEIKHTFDLAESEQREIDGGNVDMEAQAAYDEYYAAGNELPESSEYLLEIKRKRQGVKRHRDRRPKAQPLPQPGTMYAPGAIGFVKTEISSRLNDVADVTAIPLPSDEMAPVKAEPEEEPEQPQVQNFVVSEPEPEKIINPNTGIGGWTRVAKKEKPDELFFSPLTARYRELEAQEKLEAAEAASIVAKKEKKEEKIEFTEKVAKVKVKGVVEFKKRTGGGDKNTRKREE